MKKGYGGSGAVRDDKMVRSTIAVTEQNVRAELARLQARYDGIIPPAVYPTIRALQVELAWIEHWGVESEREEL